MPTGLAPTTANSILNALCRNAAWATPVSLWVQLHVGQPGAAGTTTPALNNVRKQATFGTAAAGGSLSNTVSVPWTAVPNAETYTHFSVWDASTAGNFQFSGTLTANAVLVGDNFTINIGDCTVSLTVAS